MIVVPVLPLPWLQCTATTLCLFSWVNKQGTFEKIIHFLGNHKQGVQCRWQMIPPLVFDNTVTEVLVIVFTGRYVYDEVIVAVFLKKVLGNVLDWVTVGGFKARGGEGHCYDPIGDVGEIQLLIIPLKFLFGSGNYFSTEFEHWSRLLLKIFYQHWIKINYKWEHYNILWTDSVQNNQKYNETSEKR